MRRDNKLSRTTVILGAGAVLDFDYSGMVLPATNIITKEVVNQTIHGLNDENSDLLKHIYDRIVDVSRSEYLKVHPAVRFFEPKVTFEDLFEVVETLYSYNGTWNHEQYPFPFIAALVQSCFKFPSIDYYNAMVAIVERIFEIVTTYDKKFREEGREQWYKTFWNEFDNQIDVFNLNYDTTVENSLGNGNFTDGFVGFSNYYERFDPEVLWNATTDIASVNHIHGCILYADINPKPAEFHYSHRDLYKLYPDVASEVFIGRQLIPRNQVGDSIFYSPFITGLKKTDKICFMPNSFYHANLVKKIIENPSLLICGYSFGDLYINQLLQRHKLIHGEEERVIIVDRWPVYVNEGNVSLYRYFMDETSSGFREFVERVTEGGVAPLETFKKFTLISDGCWQSPQGSFRLYTKGLKYSVEGHGEEIVRFLNGSI